MTSYYNMLVVTGPTATGKTRLAAHVAAHIGGEIISADSRQVYRGMDIGTGKDLDDYMVDGQKIPAHLVDIVDAGYQYNVYEFQRDFLIAYDEIKKRNRFPILCGGSGLYIEAVLNNYKLIGVPVNAGLRESLQDKPLEKLTEILKSYKGKLHNSTDIVNAKRAVRAIEIEDFYANNRNQDTAMPEMDALVVGVNAQREARRERITQRLHQRLHKGMVEEVKSLLDSGISPDNLIYYGLEYKFITLYIIGELTFDQMVEKLNTAIHQFAKRQMTWFRKMERQGTVIRWLDINMPSGEKIETIVRWLSER
ncbi:MAG: tRNA (adenosine(37)-N6)-dimethylallyltransferase MiaA [Prolixibacteraceae bacterium]|nr:tRNA (adenosine(37)-N6)-dimethylallyltransferase MiaA [Prolixibacteraceae bacterium]